MVVAKMQCSHIDRQNLIHLDGILAQAAYRDLDTSTRLTLAPITGSAAPVDLSLPLSRWYMQRIPELHGNVPECLLRVRHVSADELGMSFRDAKAAGIPTRDEPAIWGWCASAQDYGAHVLHSQFALRKKPAIGEMVKYTDDSSVNIGAGHLKAYDLTFPAVFAPTVTWYCHGDMGETLRLLREHIPAIGGKTSIGNGVVMSWDAEPMTEDWSIERNGSPSRRLPVGALVDDQGVSIGTIRARGTIRPPYYHRSRYVASQEP